MSSQVAILEAAERAGATVVRVPGAHIVILPDAAPVGPERLALAEAAAAACTSLRVLREAIRTGELPAAGRQRDRSVLRADLEAWVAKRAVKVTVPDDDDLERRIARLQHGRSARDAEGMAP